MTRKVFIVVENGELALVSNEDLSKTMEDAVSSGQLSGEVYHEEVDYDDENNTEITTSHGHKISCIDIDLKLDEDTDDIDWDEDEWEDDEYLDEDEDEDWGYSDDEEEIFTDEELSDEGIEVNSDIDEDFD